MTGACRCESKEQPQATKIFTDIAFNSSWEKISCHFIISEAISLSAVSAISAHTHTKLWDCTTQRDFVLRSKQQRRVSFVLLFIVENSIFSPKSLCQIAFGAVSTHFIYSSAFKVSFSPILCVSRTTGSLAELKTWAAPLTTTAINNKTLLSRSSLSLFVIIIHRCPLRIYRFSASQSSRSSAVEGSFSRSMVYASKKQFGKGFLAWKFMWRMTQFLLTLFTKRYAQVTSFINRDIFERLRFSTEREIYILFCEANIDPACGLEKQTLALLPRKMSGSNLSVPGFQISYDNLRKRVSPSHPLRTFERPKRWSTEKGDESFSFFQLLRDR